VSRLLPLEDFRSRRKALVRSDFAYAPKPPQRPSDHIDPKTWHHFMVLPDDVASLTPERWMTFSPPRVAIE
jgi:hypothetical protein